MRIVKNKRWISLLFLCLLMINILAPVWKSSKAHAQAGLIKSLTVEPKEVRQGEAFRVSGTFGDETTRVRAGQTETIYFDRYRTKIQFPEATIALNDPKSGQQMATLSFSGDQATITFNEFASKLEGVKGAFDFTVNATWAENIQIPGEGSITVHTGAFNEVVKFVNPESGTTTDEIYSKQGTGLFQTGTMDQVKWAFSFNEAKKATGEDDLIFEVRDRLPDTMVWDMPAINAQDYVVEMDTGYGMHWFTLAKARELGLEIDINENTNELFIKVPSWVRDEYHPGHFVRPLDRKSVSIHLIARVKEEVMRNFDIETVHNQSETSVTVNRAQRPDWKINPELERAEVKIQRLGGWATGTKRGELKILKVLPDGSTPIQGVKFTLRRDDGADIITRIDGVEKNHGPVVVLTTTTEGIANIKGLQPAAYSVQETGAPDWIKFDVDQPIKKTFTVTGQDIAGHEYKIQNKKKTIDISVEKQWKKADGQPLADIPSIQVALFRDNQQVDSPVTLQAGALSHRWTGLEMADDQGRAYRYEVKEMIDGKAYSSGETMEINGQKYRLTIEGDTSSGFQLVNQRAETPVTQVKVHKALRGTGADPTKQFRFHATYTSVDPVSQEEIYHNREEFTLIGGQEKVFQYLKLGSAFLVEESTDTAQGYRISVKIDQKEAVQTLRASIDPLDQDHGHSIVFTNEKNLVPDTGVHLDQMPYGLLLAVAIGIGLVGFVRVRPHKDGH